MIFTDSLIGRPNTINSQISLFKRHVNPEFPTKMKSITEEDIRTAYTSWVKQGLSPNTIRSLLSISRKYVDWGGGRIEASIWRKYSAAVGRSRQKTEPASWSKEEMIRFVDYSKQTKHYPLCLLALHTGMRRGEVFGLKNGDVDFERGIITVRRSYGGPTKNGKSRVIPMSRKLEDILIDLNVDSGDAEEQVFDKCTNPNSHLKTLCKEAKVPVVTFHALRHTFATLALEAGKSPKKVSETLGHSNLSTTLDVYWRSTKDYLEMDFL